MNDTGVHHAGDHRPGDHATAPGEHEMRWPLVRLLRPEQWLKNVLVAAPLIYSARFLEQAAAVDTALTIGLFCLAASATYVWNDLQDIASDRQHPIKRHTRPLAAGALSPTTGWATLGVLLVLLAGGILLEPLAMLAIGGYLVINAGYSLWLKHEPVIDLFAIAAGFVLRVYAGALAIAVSLSAWMLITTLCLALYLAINKRRQELMSVGSEARRVLEEYPPKLLDHYSHFTALGAVVFYGIYAAVVRPSLAMTVPLVILGFFRYSYLVESEGKGEAPTEMLYKDPFLAVTVFLWMGLSAYSLWPA